MAPSRELRGRPAAPGLALGRLVRLTAVNGQRRPTGDAAGARVALGWAIDGAIADLAALQTAAGDAAGSEMLDFQIAMLEDEALRAPALEAIAKGTAADAAWSATLAAQIADYEVGSPGTELEFAL